MEPNWALVIILAGSYLAGSIPTGVLVARALSGMDIRKQGSRNIGATNVARLIGKKAGLVTLAGDALKGALPVWVAQRLAPSFDAPVFWWMAAAGMAAFIGHLFSVYLGFRGGKGVATALGVFLAAAPMVALGCLGVFAAGVALSRRVSVGSLSAAAMAPPAAYGWYGGGPIFLLSVGIALCIAGKHSGNIRRLIRGEEPRWNESGRRL